MTRTKKVISMLAALAMIAISGCEWSSPSSEDTWTMAGYDWFDFSGTYRGADGGPVVTGFIYEDPTETGVVTDEIIASASGSQSGQVILSPALNISNGSSTTMTAFGAPNIVPGSVTLSIAGGATLKDDAAGGLVIVSGGGDFALSSSNVDYAAGIIALTVQVLDSSAFSSSEDSVAVYQYSIASAYSGNFAHSSVIAGSVTIFAGDYVFTEYFPAALDYERAITEGKATLRTSDGKTGTISYSTGAWSIDLGGITVSGDVTASYSYEIKIPFEPGNTGEPIVTLAISQVGNKITLIDSVGRTFNGTIGWVTGSGGTTPPTSDNNYSTQVMAQFTAYYEDIEISGSFTGMYSSDEPGILFNRTIEAVWIEPTIQGDVNGTTTAVYVPEFIQPSDDDTDDTTTN